MKKRWFRKDVKVFDLIKHIEGEYWSDPSYGEALQSTWTLTGRLQPTDFECEQNGYVYMPHVSTENYNYEYTGLYFYKRWRVKCE